MYKTYKLSTYHPEASYDAVAFIASCLSEIPKDFASYTECLESIAANDKTFGTTVSVAPSGNKLILFKSTGPLIRDYDDPRSFAEAANAAVSRALSAGKSNILLVPVFNVDVQKHPEAKQYAQYKLVSTLGALEATYVPLENRERVEHKKQVIQLSVYEASEQLLKIADETEQGLVVGRDLGGGDPERMAPPKMAEFTRLAFADLPDVKIKVIADQDEIAKNYPCFQAVNRACLNVPRHHGRVIFLEYEHGNPEEHLVFVGKGVTYDTGGADVKAGGAMAGMHRDKCGASNVIGFMRSVGALKPKNIKITAAAACVRNSIGSECYVSDEIIRTRAGKYIRVGNTDAEGRMAMVDVLCHLKERSVEEKWKDPRFFTWATLTGHSCLAFGEHYTAIMDNGPARRSQTAQRLQKAGHSIADPFEISTIRREDYFFHAGKDVYSDHLQSNSAPSTRTPRGHQCPSAFMIGASGLDKHGLDSAHPIQYTHCDIAPSAGPYPGLPTGNPIRAFLNEFIYQRINE